MTTPITLPLWLLLLILALAAVATLTHVLVPSVRWFFRRRVERLVAQLNTRLAQPIRPFKLMRRSDMIVRLVHDPAVMEAVVAEAAETGEPESVTFARARRYAKEIIPSFSAIFYYGFATRAARRLVQLAYRVRIGHFDASEIDAIDPDATLIFVMNHRSNMDYVLVTHLVSERSTLSYAVGEWARVWPLSSLIRAMGAYFIRRNSGNQLYRRVLARYVQMATEEGVAQAIYPEGGLSLDGRVGQAKLGLISYILAGFREGQRDIVFVPVALSYDRVLEDRVLTQAAAAGVRRFRARIGTIVAFMLRNGWRRVRGRFKRFGVAAVSFGTPLSLSGFLETTRDNPAEALATELMGRVVNVVPILPVPLTAAALGTDTTLSRKDLAARIDTLIDQLEEHGATVHRPQDTTRTAAQAGIDALTLRGILTESDGSLSLNPGQTDLIAFYAASVHQALNAAAAIPAQDTPDSKSSKS